MDELRENFVNLINEYVEQTGYANVAMSLKLSDFVKTNIPNKLYRYRNISEYNISALKNEEVWMTKPSLMNDYWDSATIIYSEKVKEYYEKNYEQFLDEAVKLQLEITNVDLDILNMLGLKKEEFAECLIEMRNNQLLINLFKEMIREKCERIFPKVEFKGSKIEKDFQSMRYIACFSENITSNLMWGQYAASHTGFALEYDFKVALNRCKYKDENCLNLYMNFLILPVIYKEMYDISKFAYDVGERSLLSVLYKDISKYHFRGNMTLSYLLPYIYKSEEWSIEKEWRLLSPIGENFNLEREKDHICIHFPPSAIYCGVRMLDKDKKILKDIADEKHIPIFQMIATNGVFEYIKI